MTERRRSGEFEMKNMYQEVDTKDRFSGSRRSEGYAESNGVYVWQSFNHPHRHNMPPNILVSSWTDPSLAVQTTRWVRDHNHAVHHGPHGGHRPRQGAPSTPRCCTSATTPPPPESSHALCMPPLPLPPPPPPPPPPTTTTTTTTTYTRLTARRPPFRSPAHRRRPSHTSTPPRTCCTCSSWDERAPERSGVPTPATDSRQWAQHREAQ
jgi:hypothetical protein